jgi:hypothetical protein
MCAPPSNKEVLKKTGIPLAVIATPFAGQESGDDAVPCVDMGESPPRYTYKYIYIYICIYI